MTSEGWLAAYRRLSKEHDALCASEKCVVCGAGAIRLRFDGQTLFHDCMACGTTQAGDVVLRANVALAQLERDAARYRWLRSSAYVWGNLPMCSDQQEEDVSIWIKGNVPMDDAGMDAAVDAAMRQSASDQR